MLDNFLKNQGPINVQNEPPRNKTNKKTVRPVKTQTSLISLRCVLNG